GAIHTAGGVSGAHLNPAFSFAMCLLEQFPWWKFPIFAAMQILGAFLSAGAVYALYYDAIWHYGNGTLTTSGPRETASIFATYPADYLSLSNGFLDQVIGTALLIMGVLAMLDTRNKSVPKGLEPVAMALLGFLSRSPAPRAMLGGHRASATREPPSCPICPQSNCIKTSKYNIVTFLPVNLFEQFQEVANTYFLFLLILQLIPQISSLSWFTTIVPLVLVLTITAVKDATDDYFRHKSDNQVNNRQSQVLIGGVLRQEQWMNVRVGDIIKLENNQFVAADLLLLSSSEPHGLCYIETAELDGETNMKVRQAIPVTSELGDTSKLARFDGEVICEPPNNKLDKFGGTLYWKDNKYPLSNQNMLLRGCVLRNTEWCFGLVIFAGPDTKLMQNSGRTKFKRTSIDRLMNTLVLWIFGFLVCMGVILAIGNAIWEHEVGVCFQIYLPWDEGVHSAFFSGFLSFWSYIIILNTVVPISLYVSMGSVTLSPERRWIPVLVNSMPRLAGDVQDVLGHKAELGERPEPVDFSFNPLADLRFQFWDPSLLEAVKLGDPHVHEFFRLLSLCHTVMSEEKSEGELFYKAQSPDEGALVTAARNFGFVFRSRTPKTITVHELGRAITYQLLAILDFNNIRKRMSVIVRSPEGKIRLYCKGADTILLERLHPINQDLTNVTTDHLNEYAGEGRLEVREELRKAREKMMDASRSMGNGFSYQEKLSSSKLTSVLEAIAGEYALVINGHSLAHALEADMEVEFLETACACKAVICCRVTPLQKAQVVELVKKYKKAVTLAIGDGANDVSMIKTAHIGVGISGQEGIQAVLASDYSFSQFKFLQRLLLVHGRWSYLRMCKFLCYFFYKNFAFTMVHFWFGFFCGFSAQTVYDQYFITLYNIVYTSLPVLAMGVFDQDVPEQRSMEYPKLYEPGQLNLLFNKREFFICIAQGIYTSVLMFFIPYGVFADATRDDGAQLADYQSFAVTVATSLVIVVSVQIGLDTGFWTAINHFFIWGSLAAYFAILFAMHSDSLFQMFPNQFRFVGNAQNTLAQPTVWLTIALTTVVCIMPVVAFRFLKLDLKPELSDTVRYTQLVRKKQKTQHRCMRRVGRVGSRRSGYAFSHQEGFGELIMSGKNMRLSSLALSSFTARPSAGWIETLRKKKGSDSSTAGSPSGTADKTLKV
ncbi:PREDICTED: phospholipid-transporting ATPase ID-like, partial [Pygoscelis adeliae]|uniref:phospholipid-transporting ATPase ID-like n=1 Tax=Pygoscelis adeliae TaxID=9238 RepID=UPI0004F4F28A